VQSVAVQVADPWAGAVLDVMDVGPTPRVSFPSTLIVTATPGPVVALSATAAGIGITVVGSLELLFELFGSTTVALTVAVFVTDGAAAGPTWTDSVIADEAPEARPAGFVHVTAWPTAPHVQPEPLAPTKVRPAGNVSATVTAPDATLPAFASASV